MYVRVDDAVRAELVEDSDVSVEGNWLPQFQSPLSNDFRFVQNPFWDKYTEPSPTAVAVDAVSKNLAIRNALAIAGSDSTVSDDAYAKLSPFTNGVAVRVDDIFLPVSDDDLRLVLGDWWPTSHRFIPTRFLRGLTLFTRPVFPHISPDTTYAAIPTIESLGLGRAYLPFPSGTPMFYNWLVQFRGEGADEETYSILAVSIEPASPYIYIKGILFIGNRFFSDYSDYDFLEGKLKSITLTISTIASEGSTDSTETEVTIDFDSVSYTSYFENREDTSILPLKHPRGQFSNIPFFAGWKLELSGDKGHRLTLPSFHSITAVSLSYNLIPVGSKETRYLV